MLAAAVAAAVAEVAACRDADRDSAAIAVDSDAVEGPGLGNIAEGSHRGGASATAEVDGGMRVRGTPAAAATADT